MTERSRLITFWRDHDVDESAEAYADTLLIAGGAFVVCLVVGIVAAMIMGAAG